MKGLIFIAIPLLAGLAAVTFAPEITYQKGIQKGRSLEQQDFYAEAINAGVGEFGPDGNFRFKKP